MKAKMPRLLRSLFADAELSIGRSAPGPSSAPGRPISFTLHGHAVSLNVESPALWRTARLILSALGSADFPDTPALEGSIREFNEAEVMRSVSADAVAVVEGDAHFHPLLELFRSPDGGRWWLVDERWGMCEIDLIRRSWRSFVLPEPSIDAVRLFEQVVWWPMAQLLRGYGLHLIPAASVGRAGKGVLLLAPYELDPEMLAMRDAKLGVIGQRWTALRETSDGKIMLLPVPGRTESAPAARPLSGGPIEPLNPDRWIDVGVGEAAECNLVLVIEPMRRARASTVPLSQAEALQMTKLAWPIPALGPNNAVNALSARVARSCPVHRVRLGRDGHDLGRLLTGRSVPGEHRIAA